MKRMTSVVVGSLFAILIVSGAFTAKLQAQEEPGIIFSVPFAFSTDGHNIPAGRYEINLVLNHYLMSIRNLQTGDVQIFSVRPEQQRTIASKGLLIFHRCGDRKDLVEFHIPGSDIYSETIAPRRLRNLEACQTTGNLTVAAR